MVSPSIGNSWFLKRATSKPAWEDQACYHEKCIAPDRWSFRRGFASNNDGTQWGLSVNTGLGAKRTWPIQMGGLFKEEIQHNSLKKTYVIFHQEQAFLRMTWTKTHIHFVYMKLLILISISWRFSGLILSYHSFNFVTRVQGDWKIQVTDAKALQHKTVYSKDRPGLWISKALEAHTRLGLVIKPSRARKLVIIIAS